LAEKFANGGVDVALVSTAAPLVTRAEQNLGAQAMQESVASSVSPVSPASASASSICAGR
jgi:hypothetical protein